MNSTMSDSEMDDEAFARNLRSPFELRISKEQAERKARGIAMTLLRQQPLLIEQPILGLQKFAEWLHRYMKGVYNFEHVSTMFKSDEASPESEHNAKQPQLAEPNRYGQVQGLCIHRNLAISNIGVREVRNPIIVVPSQVNSQVTLHNIKPLLEDLNYKYPFAMRRWNDPTLHEVTVMRSYRKVQEYTVVHDVSTLSEQDWKHVVAVFVYNPKVQFIGWPFKGHPTAICRNFCVFHLAMEGDAIWWTLDSLYVNIIVLPRSNRHRERKILKMLWRKIDKYMDKADCKIDSDDEE